MLNLILFGAPGAGKGTQAEMLTKKYNFIHLSTGEMLRTEIAQGTPRGIAAKALMDQGEFVPDNTVLEMVAEQIQTNPNAEGFIFDGFPRTTPQAEMLDKVLAYNGTSITAMIALDAPEDELVKRLLSRGKISGRSDDQDESIIRNRIQVYNQKTQPLIGYYNAQKKYVNIKGIGEINIIFNNLCTAIDQLSY
ncbi:MAG: adenylate kinase [Bacteroidales bacterium]